MKLTRGKVLFTRDFSLHICLIFIIFMLDVCLSNTLSTLNPYIAKRHVTHVITHSDNYTTTCLVLPTFTLFVRVGRPQLRQNFQHPPLAPDVDSAGSPVMDLG